MWQAWPLRGFLGNEMSYFTPNRTYESWRLILLGLLAPFSSHTRADRCWPCRVFSTIRPSLYTQQRVFRDNIIISPSKQHQHSILQQFSNITFSLYNLPVSSVIFLLQSDSRAYARKACGGRLEPKTHRQIAIQGGKKHRNKRTVTKCIHPENRTECFKNLFIDGKRKFKVTGMKTK